MSAPRGGTAASAAAAIGLVVVAAVTWQWRATVFRTERAALERESWAGIQEEFPLPAEARPSITGLPPAAVDATAAANPFSPQRRKVPAATGGGETGSESPGTTNPAQPQFTYKGRILVGPRQRAVVEDLTSRKTHFLEVGQEVAGFKVLDIAESQVLLSDPRTGSEVVLTLNKPAASP